MLRAVIFTILAACAQLAQAQVLWQGLSAGMTPDEVRAAMPAAETVNNPTIKMTTGAQGSLRIPGQVVEGKAFDATLFFAGDRLIEVQLVHEAKVEVPQGRAAYNEVLQSLRAKHGEERMLHNAHSSQEVAWQAGDAVLILQGFFTRGSTVLNLIYVAGKLRPAS